MLKKTMKDGTRYFVSKGQKNFVSLFKTDVEYITTIETDISPLEIISLTDTQFITLFNI